MNEQALRDIFEWLNKFPPDVQLEKLLAAARETGLKKLEPAIIEYWYDLEFDEILTADDFAGAQEESIRAQFGEDNDT